MSQAIRITRTGDIIATGRASVNQSGAIRINVAQGETEDYAFTWDAKTGVTSAVVATNFTATSADSANVTTLTISGVGDTSPATGTLTLTGDGETRVLMLEVGSVVGKKGDAYGGA